MAGEHVIGQPEILLGFPPSGDSQRLSRLVGSHRALRTLLEGAGLAPAAAAYIGLVDDVVPADERLDRAVALAEGLGKRMTLASAAIKRAAYIGGSLGLEEALHVTEEVNGTIGPIDPTDTPPGRSKT